MALSYIWCGLMLFSLVFSLFAGTSAQVGAAALSGSVDAIELIISIAGPICIWSGVMEVMRRGGIAAALSRALRPITVKLMPSTKNNPEAREAIAANVSANMLGLGNAATPLGIRAVREMQKRARGAETMPTADMCVLIVLNASSIQLIPTTVAAIRLSLGSSAPFDILPAVWVTSAVSLVSGLLAAKILSKFL